jgi:hypothetical protein
MTGRILHEFLDGGLKSAPHVRSEVFETRLGGFKQVLQRAHVDRMIYLESGMAGP